ncbi:PREDICTED: paired amphipathic helix protein Sin3b isoform X1 [Trachymyrmex cornetzi]|uniref:Paired amphipathic helix protein Sin3a n=1 Tax=Trachymyrmex cornetzi TaxID=471704 RepID=A0A195DIV6_9HYME|nr:PREDICTED: paired amphipathic helix protein Sin3b isoform X1 [Trachymyrmex cornetzi]XP_018372234.1 PREDICTED: paired amphipathic helix protein Sin3b isoform X1 [Trachymyrmex cornetzi]KYN12810.1 Paired amphipathic helix protein Sin3a [Trachymyrmex cornetzi]
MKRVRGLDDIASAPAKHSSVSAASGLGGGGGSLDYHASSGIGVVVPGQAVRSVASKEMPGSIQFGTAQAQQQYTGAIVVPTAAPSPIKQASGSAGGLGSTCSSSSINTGGGLHSGIGGGNSHTMASQQPTSGSQNQVHAQQQSTIRHKVHSGNVTPLASTPPGSNLGGGSGSQQFQRLKVEDALSYLDQVKYKFSDQPQVYNDFLDIMKEFKSQSIDTPGVITRVSHLFKGHPELIVGFNTFLPPGYKIEVQANEQGYAFQVSVSMPSPTATHTATLSQHHCTVNVGSPPVASPPTQPAKAPPVLQIMPGSGNIHHTLANSITTNSLTVHAPSPPPSVSVYNNSHVSTAQAQAVSQALNQADGVSTGGQTQQSQPVEFNHAINYVNKIKNRFQGQPDKYKRFLEILHTYQKEQRNLKESGHMGGTSSGATGGTKHLTEAEVYSQVAKLFENQEDLLAEFGQFLPDATNQQNSLTNKTTSVNDHTAIVKKPIGLKTPYNNSGTISRDLREASSTAGLERDNREHRERERERDRSNIRDMSSGQKCGHSTGQLKRSPSFSTSATAGNSHHIQHGPPPSKKHKVASMRDISIAEAGKYGTLNDYAFFDKVRKALRSQDVYENFLRCLVLFNQEIISKSELIQLVTPFLGRFPELLRWFKDFLGYLIDSSSTTVTNAGNAIGIETFPNSIVRSHQERPQGDLAIEIDYTACKRLGASYCALPKSYIQPKCSGRTQLCKEVLNDTWVSFPTWSEDSTFVTSRKTQYEESIYRCEDERFELDVVIETNASTIRVLEGVHKKMNRMTQEEVQKYKLDECMGGCSPTIHQRAIKRIYGDKASDIIEGLKRNPVVAVPVVLRRLKAKEEEWREAQKGFNKIWREQNEKYYLKSLDHQGINFKQNDVKALRSKSLFNEIETLYDERHEQGDDGNGDGQGNSGPHLVLSYKDKSVLDDAANLLIHHVKRQTAVHKEDKQRIKLLLKHFIPDLFFHPRQELSDDERDEDDEKEDVNMATCNNSQSATNTSSSLSGLQANRSKAPASPSTSSATIKSEPDVKVPMHALSSDPEEAYTLFMGSNNWYLFLRLHHILCERLTKMYDRAVALAEEESKYKQQRRESTAVALRLKPKSEIEIEDYYPAFLDMVKNVLDGNMESTAYEDTLREMFGIHAYIAFTLDKVVNYAVRQLQHLVSDSVCQQCMDLFQREQRQPKENSGAGGLCATAYMRLSAELSYQRKAEKAMADENCFKIYIYKKDCKMTMELLDTEGDETVDNGCREREREGVTVSEKWSTYVERFSAPAGQTSPKDTPALTENEQTTNHPVSNDQAARGGRGRKRKNTDISKKIDGNTWGSSGRSSAGRKPTFLCRNIKSYRKHAARLMRGKTSSLNANHPDKVAESSDTPDMINSDETQCRFNPNSYTMLFIVHKDRFLYKQNSMNRARRCHPAVTKRKDSKFHHWHSLWISKNGTDIQHRLCQDWLMGRYENLIPHRTRVITDNDQTRSPYRQYNRFRVERLQSDLLTETCV